MRNKKSTVENCNNPLFSVLPQFDSLSYRNSKMNYKVFCFFSTRFNEFDHRFFGISEAEASFMDPQQKLLLQCSYRALEDSGIPIEKVSGSRTGVYIGNNNSIPVYDFRYYLVSEQF